MKKRARAKAKPRRVTVYSYIRFSSKAQAEGDSLRRQTEAAQKFCDKHGYRLADLTYRDLGLSGFTGEHRHKGALGALLEAIKDGTIKKGSIILVENLDRLSREGIYEAVPLFMGILNAGIKIAVLKPDEKIYDNRKNPELIDVLMPLICFYLAHLESLNKSGRVNDALDEKREELYETGKPFSSRRPAWIDWEDGKFKLNRKKAKAIRFIFQKTIDGIGGRVLVRLLNERFDPINERANGAGMWTHSTVQSYLKHKATFGEFQPITLVDGKKTPAGPPIPDYYPAVIDEGTFYKAQQATASRRTARGRSSTFVNVFVGLVTYKQDGAKANITSTSKNGKTHRRFQSYSHKNGLPGACPLSVSYSAFEELVLHMIWELRPEHVKPTDVNLPTEDIEKRTRELEAVKGRLHEIEEKLADPNQSLDVLIGTAKRLEKNRDKLQEEIEELKQEAAVNGHGLEECHTIQQLLEATKDEDETHKLRMKLRAELPRLVKSITLAPRKEGATIITMAEVVLKNGRGCAVEFENSGRLHTMYVDPPYAVPFLKKKKK